LLAERLRGAGLAVVLTREPGGTALGERIREVVLARDTGGARDRDPMADALLFNAARRQLVSELIRPGLAAGTVVVCDRFADSTLAYQGYGAGLSLEALRRLAALATDGLVPDRTILLDVPVDHGLARRAEGPAVELTRFEHAESHDRAFHERVRAGFLSLAAQEPERWRIVDARADRDAVGQAVWEAVLDVLPVPRPVAGA
jgi:dTMP kinase